jgi:glycosyltransferase involved in cell wall biosynthesis
VPVVQPDHGSFPEMIARTGGGLLVTPDDPESLAAAWAELTEHRDRREQLSHAGYHGVREHFSVERMIERTVEVFS